MPSKTLTWFITGANSGFGLLLSRLALSQGHTVIATARSTSKFPPDLAQNPNSHLLELQITSPGEEIAKILNDILTKHNQIDVLVNNAGFAHLGAVEELSEAEARYQFDVNFFGLLNVTKAIIPHMRARKSGVIVQISSGAGVLAGQGGPIYSASKFAVEGLSEAMAVELQSFGIRVHLVEPGIFRTEFLGPVSRGQNISKKVEGYFDIGGVLTGMNGQQPGDPVRGVQRIFDVVTGTGMGRGLEGELRILLGGDVFGMVERKRDMLSGTLEVMKEVAFSTDFEE
ncbi:short chain oxidoreductase protein [Pochonia chlamydosporia 170]|uniref:Short chain oxidoreductase protein n=1 Tax=Pochonia chlamydosporia 170 TaxID=1380566 RepID=A0A179FWL3_METCM|nr:short chain oxidoreductase protein [Pochonia chlamydosporia 170]OAQ70056.1 short chain oxidoreductase protein [Pochonia chlamydosporia 170]